MLRRPWRLPSGTPTHSRRTTASIRRGSHLPPCAAARSRSCRGWCASTAPTGNAASERSCGQPALTVAAAAGPVTAIAILRCEMPTAECSALTPAQSASGSLPASSMTSHSSGPSHSALRLSFVDSRFRRLRQGDAERLGQGRDRGSRRAQRYPLGRRQHGERYVAGRKCAAGKCGVARGDASRRPRRCSLSH